MVGQHPSLETQAEIGSKEQLRLQVALAPDEVLVVQARLSSQPAGQFPSQVSPASTMPLLQAGEQSSSLRLLQPVAQQLSPEMQALMVIFEHWAVQFAAEPVKVSTVHAFWSSQWEGQSSASLPSPSQVSGASTTSFPQDAEQSLSVTEVQELGQQSSASMQFSMAVLLH